MTKREREAIERAVAWLHPAAGKHDSEPLHIRAKIAELELTTLLELSSPRKKKLKSVPAAA